MINRKIPLFKELLIELQSNCNRECFFCIRQGDDSGIRRDAQGNKVIRSMPTDQVINILDQAALLGFKGWVAFHILSEAFLDHRIIGMAREAKKRGMRPFIFTNGDILKQNLTLAKAASEVFEYVVVGLYDYQSKAELFEERRFWRQRLKGTKVSFSDKGEVIPRAPLPYDPRMIRKKRVFPKGVCLQPGKMLRVQYNGNVSLCCEDMQEQFDLGNAFKTPIKDIWYSEKHIQIYRDLKKGLRTKYPLCSVCSKHPHPDLFFRITRRARHMFSAFKDRLT